MLQCRLAVSTKKGNAPFYVPRCKDNEFEKQIQIGYELSLQKRCVYLQDMNPMDYWQRAASWRRRLTIRRAALSGATSSPKRFSTSL